MKKKQGFRFLAGFLCCVLLVCGITLPASAAQFSDVPYGEWFSESVYDLVDQGIVNGKPPTTFKPYDKLTRAEFVTMLAKTVLTKSEVDQYRFKGSFRDVFPSQWYNPYVNWASEAGVVNGYEDKTFRPEQYVTREELARMVTNFARATGRQMTPDTTEINFTDKAKISNFAKASVSLCQRCGIINGYEDGSFRPGNTANRGEAATLYARFLKKCASVDYSILRKRVNNIPVRAVEFDPSNFRPHVALGNNLVDGQESASSIVQRSGARIAVNAAFFDMKSYMPVGTIVTDGRVVTIDNKYPDKSAFTLDSSGNASVENYVTWYTATLQKEDGFESVIQKVSANKWPSSSTDAARLVFTRDWGHTLCFDAKDAVTVDSEGFITSVAADKEVAIPALDEGYVLAQRSRRQYEGDFFDSCQVGDRISLDLNYDGSSTQDIMLSVAAGPRLVKNGQVYGGLNTYISEGFSDPNITTYTALRMCIGIKPDGNLLIATATCTLQELSSILVKLGCSDGINLDGGGSATLYVGGQWLCGPQSRKLNNMIVFQ